LRTLNLGILAHVDAGKTSLTERLLFDAGVIGEIGSVDHGSTQTDTLALERQRGITIKSAVASFAAGDLNVSIIDTPGHPDFIAEVERVLAVLDGAVLVISAVEGVQAQTRVLMRALQRLHIPTLIFVNKIDRRGADTARVLAQIAARLTPAVIAMGLAVDEGARTASFVPHEYGDPAFGDKLAEQLAERSDRVLAAIVDGTGLTARGLRRELGAQVRRAAIHPVYLGSAITGAGVPELVAGLRTLLPGSSGDPDGAVSGLVFKVDRGPAGEKVAFVRMSGGTIVVRDRVPFGAGQEGRVTGVRVFGPGGAAVSERIAAGQIGQLWGLTGIRIGDAIGPAPTSTGPPGAAEATTGEASTGVASGGRHFAPPTLETVVVPDRAADRARMHSALTLLAEQDPLINLRQDEVRQEALLSLYGEVQKEIIQQTLAAEFGIAVGFSETTTLCIERLAGPGAAVERMSEHGNPFKATIGLRIDPGPAGSGIRFGLEIEPGALPRAFQQAIETTARETLRQGLHGWQVADCAIALTESGYVPPPPTGWSKFSSSAADFRNLTPLVVMAALREAGTAVCEPVHAFTIEAPADSIGVIMPALARMGAIPLGQRQAGSSVVIEGHIPAAAVRELQLLLPGLTGGEGVLEAAFDRYRPVRGTPPERPRSDYNPLNRQAYLLQVSRRVTGAG
jgi:ribosomal protection tetracycline resistance protein